MYRKHPLNLFELYVIYWSFLISYCNHYSLFFFRRNAPTPQLARASSFVRFLDHTQRPTAVGRSPLDEWSARRRDLYLTTQHEQQTNIHAAAGIRTRSLSKRAAADLRLRPRDPWNQKSLQLRSVMIIHCRRSKCNSLDKPYINSQYVYKTRLYCTVLSLYRRISCVGPLL